MTTTMMATFNDYCVLEPALRHVTVDSCRSQWRHNMNRCVDEFVVRLKIAEIGAGGRVCLCAERSVSVHCGQRTHQKPEHDSSPLLTARPIVEHSSSGRKFSRTFVLSPWTNVFLRLSSPDVCPVRRQKYNCRHRQQTHI